MNNSQKIALVSVVMSIGTFVPGVFAGELKDSYKDLREAKQEVREEKKDFFQSVREKTGTMVNRLVKAGKAVIIGGKITAKTDTTLTVEKDGISYAVNLGSSTQLRRRFWGKSELTEFSVGNSVNVYGVWTDDTKTAINARFIRNISIQKRFGVFFGKVKSLLSNGWIMSTVSEKRPDQTVTVSSETKFVNRRGETVSQSDIQVGHRVRVKGLWDMSANTVTEVTHVKDFSLPAQAGLPPTPTP